MGDRMPKSRVEFWRQKLRRNKERDQQHLTQLRRNGWSVLIVWECETLPAQLETLASRLRDFLGTPGRAGG
jgi:DNA mismatch endonuclease (patch repair protein)